jgi:hypothetical protein
MRRGAFLAAGLLLGAGAAQAAMPVRDPDWPCQQIRMPALSVGAVWNGPDLTPYLSTWSADHPVADLVRRVAQRRMPLDQAQAAIHDFAAASGAAKQERLLRLAAGLFSTLDAERAQVIAGLDRFGRRQKELAAEIRADLEKLRAQEAANGPAVEGGAGPLSDRLGWETRLFEQRRQAVAYACDVPNAIEQRLFALLRMIQEQLG